jgi:hypothetical protein
MCEYIPKELADAVIELVERYKGSRGLLKQFVKSLK